jgi:hypothetical protein
LVYALKLNELNDYFALMTQDAAQIIGATARINQACWGYFHLSVPMLFSGTFQK